jgi:hypothetical protein
MALGRGMALGVRHGFTVRHGTRDAAWLSSQGYVDLMEGRPEFDSRLGIPWRFLKKR